MPSDPKHGAIVVSRRRDACGFYKATRFKASSESDSFKKRLRWGVGWTLVTKELSSDFIKRRGVY